MAAREPTPPKTEPAPKDSDLEEEKPVEEPKPVPKRRKETKKPVGYHTVQFYV